MTAGKSFLLPGNSRRDCCTLSTPDLFSDDRLNINGELFVAFKW